MGVQEKLHLAAQLDKARREPRAVAAPVTAPPTAGEPVMVALTDQLMVEVSYRRKPSAERQARYWSAAAGEPGLTVVVGRRDRHGDYPLVWAEVRP